MLRIILALEGRAGWCFQAKHAVVAENKLVDLITRIKPNREGKGEVLRTFVGGSRVGRIAASTGGGHEGSWWL